METKTTFKRSNLRKRTPKFWKRIGDTAIYTLPMWQGVIASAPLSDTIKLWVSFVIGTVLVAAKGVTKFLGEEEK